MICRPGRGSIERVKKHRPANIHHTYSFLGVETHKHVSHEPIPTGAVTVKMLFEADQNKPGTGGKMTLWAGEKQVTFDLKPAIQADEHELHQHASLNAVAHGVSA